MTASDLDPIELQKLPDEGMIRLAYSLFWAAIPCIALVWLGYLEWVLGGVSLLGLLLLPPLGRGVCLARRVGAKVFLEREGMPSRAVVQVQLYERRPGVLGSCEVTLELLEVGQRLEPGNTVPDLVMRPVWEQTRRWQRGELQALPLHGGTSRMVTSHFKLPRRVPKHADWEGERSWCVRLEMRAGWLARARWRFQVAQEALAIPREV